MFSSDTESRVFNWVRRGSNKKQRLWTPAQQTAGVTSEERLAIQTRIIESVNLPSVASGFLFPYRKNPPGADFRAR